MGNYMTIKPPNLGKNWLWRRSRDVPRSMRRGTQGPVCRDRRFVSADSCGIVEFRAWRALLVAADHEQNVSLGFLRGRSE